MDPTSDADRVLSIQSHVASGHVGQQATVFPLQLLGYEVDVVNTVNYSNHAGYGRTGGWKSTPDGLTSILDIMEKNGLLHPSRIVTGKSRSTSSRCTNYNYHVLGYIPSAETLATISNAIRRICDRDQNVIYLLDPVMGDAGKLYVAADVVPLYRELLQTATIITPNYYEVEVLTGIPIKSVVSLQQALRVLHTKYRVPHVVISSIPISTAFDDYLPTRFRLHSGTEASLLCVASSRATADDSAPSTVHALVIPSIPGYYSGVGDLFSALVLGHFRPSHDSSPSVALSHAVSRACNTIHALLSRTHRYAMSLPLEDRTDTDDEMDTKDTDRKIRRMKGRELRLVKEQHLILRHKRESDLGDMIEWLEFWN